LRVDLSRIPDDKWWGVICENEQDLVEFVNAVKDQRKDIDIGSFNDPSNLANPRYHGKAYVLNYLGLKKLQFGRPDSLPGELSTMKFEELFYAPDLPDIGTDQLGMLSLLGL
jgi:hypothetical protein